MKSENRMNSFPAPGQVPRPFQSLTALQPLGMPVWTAAWFQWFSMGKSMDFEWFVHGIFMGGKFLEFHEIYGRICQISMKMYEILRDLMGSSWEINWMKWSFDWDFSICYLIFCESSTISLYFTVLGPKFGNLMPGRWFLLTVFWSGLWWFCRDTINKALVGQPRPGEQSTWDEQQAVQMQPAKCDLFKYWNWSNEKFEFSHRQMGDSPITNKSRNWTRLGKTDACLTRLILQLPPL